MKDELKVLAMLVGFAFLGLIWAGLDASAKGLAFQFTDGLPALVFGVVFGIGVVTPFLVVQNHLRAAEAPISSSPESPSSEPR